MPYNETALLLQVAAGNEQAFARLFEHCQPKVSYVAWKMLYEKEDVKDVLQEIMSKIWQNRSRLPLLDNFDAYLHTLTRNHIFDQFRKKAHADGYIRQYMAEEEIPADSPVTALQYKDLLASLQQLLKMLPARQRQVFTLSKLQGLKQEEIAGQMGISRETVKKHLREALKTIRVQLLKSGNQPLILLFYPVVFLKFIFP